jgi:hypothetical protein
MPDFTAFTPPPQRPVYNPPAQPAMPPRQAETRAQTRYTVTPNPNATSRLNAEIEKHNAVSSHKFLNASALESQELNAHEKDLEPSQASADATELPPFSVSIAKLEAEELLRRVTVLQNAEFGVVSALRKVIQGKEISVPEEMGMIRALEMNKNFRNEFLSLRTYLQPILHRPIGREERKLWEKKVEEIERYARDMGILSPKALSALQALGSGAILSPTDKNALEHMAQRLRRQGVELLELIRKE